MNLLLLKGNGIDGSEVSCRGPQLASIIEAIADELDTCSWVAFDVTVTSPMSSRLITADNGVVVGSATTLIEEAQKVGQFTSGVFIALPDGMEDIDLGMNIDTEGPRRMLFATSIIEIRLFDTSYFEVYTGSEELLAMLRTIFGGTEHPTD